jgi:hypothetical protein
MNESGAKFSAFLYGLKKLASPKGFRESQPASSQLHLTVKRFANSGQFAEFCLLPNAWN